MKKVTLELNDSIDVVSVTYIAAKFAETVVYTSAFQPKNGLTVAVSGEIKAKYIEPKEAQHGSD